LFGPTHITVGPVLTSSRYSRSLSTPFDTTTVPDGTYVFYPKFLDATAFSLSGLNPQPSGMIIANGGAPVITPPVQVPCYATARSVGFTSAKPDYVTYDGVPNPIHATYP